MLDAFETCDIDIYAKLAESLTLGMTARAAVVCHGEHRPRRGQRLAAHRLQC